VTLFSLLYSSFLPSFLDADILPLPFFIHFTHHFLCDQWLMGHVWDYIVLGRNKWIQIQIQVSLFWCVIWPHTHTQIYCNKYVLNISFHISMVSIVQTLSFIVWTQYNYAG
jgi:hypothetical protein